MSVLGQIEDAILAEHRLRLGARVREIDSLPGSWSVELLRRLFQKAPGVYVAFTDAKRSPRDGESWMTQPVFYSYFVTTNARGEAARRRGDGNAVGAYEMIEAVGPYLHGLRVPGIGTLKNGVIQNLFGEAAFDIGGTIYGLEHRIDNVSFEIPENDALSPFRIYHAEKRVPGGTGNEPDAIDEIELEQP